VLVEKIGIKHLMVGYDHHFGKGREGDFKTITGCALKFGFTVERFAEVSSHKIVISSTSIREALLNGKLDEANSYLGYSYSLTGVVIPGRRIGRDLGFPTANIRPSDIYKLIPGDGVYAVGVELGGKLFKGMLSIGSNPTVNKDAGIRSIEVNIFDFDGDLYNQELRVVFRFRLRDEVRFDTFSQLIRQMELDREHALRLLSEQTH